MPEAEAPRGSSGSANREYATGMSDRAAPAASKADVAILVLGDSDRTCGEMQDRSSLELLGGQPELLRRVSAAAKKTILVLLGGRERHSSSSSRGVSVSLTMRLFRQHTGPLTFNQGLCVALPKAEEGRLQQAVGSEFPWDPNESVGVACATPSLLSKR